MDLQNKIGVPNIPMQTCRLTFRHGFSEISSSTPEKSISIAQVMNGLMDVFGWIGFEPFFTHL